MNPKVTMGIAGVALLIVLGFLVSQVGNVGIRRVQPVAEDAVTITISEPAIPGVKTFIRWNVPAEAQKRIVKFIARTSADDVEIGNASFNNGVAEVEFPCTIEDHSISLVMLDASNEQVLHSQPLTMLSPGPDCLR